MLTSADYLEAFQTEFLRQRVFIATREMIGLGTKPFFDWSWLGMQLCAGEWDGFLSVGEKDSIIDSLLYYAGVPQVSEYVGIPADRCLYTIQQCYHKQAYFAPVTDYTESEMIKNLSFVDGMLTITTTNGTHSVALEHNSLAGLQGGKLSPKEYFHLSKNVHDSLNVVPSIAATATFNVTPSSGVTGTPLTPVLSISYDPGTDTIVSHTLTRGVLNIPIFSINPLGGSQSITHEPVSSVVQYVYTVNISGKPPIVITRQISFANMIFYGVSDGAVNAAMILASNTLTQNRTTMNAAFSPNEQFMFIAYPESWGMLTSILNANNFEQLPAFSQGGHPQILPLTIGGQSVNYRLYRNDLNVTVNNFPLRFLF